MEKEQAGEQDGQKRGLASSSPEWADFNRWNELADEAVRRGDFPYASIFYHRIITAATSAEAHDVRIKAILRLARSILKLGDRKQAAKLLDEAKAVKEATQSDFDIEQFLSEE